MQQRINVKTVKDKLKEAGVKANVKRVKSYYEDKIYVYPDIADLKAKIEEIGEKPNKSYIHKVERRISAILHHHPSVKIHLVNRFFKKVIKTRYWV
jgi:hypothetical protein